METIETINKACRYYPCHKNLQSCVFCFCPFYVCGNKRRGKYIKTGEDKLVWDCSQCEWIHKKSTVDKIFKEINKIFYSIRRSSGVN
jgi:Zn-finger protein